jgi:hypothetical protein
MLTWFLSIPRHRDYTLPQLFKAVDAQSEKIDLLMAAAGVSGPQRTGGNSAPPNPAPPINCPASSQEAGSEDRLIPSALLPNEAAPLTPFHSPASSTFLIGLAHLWRDQGVKSMNYPQAEADLAGYEILSMLDNGEDEVSEDDQGNEVAVTRPVTRPARLLCELSSTAFTGTRRRGLFLDPLHNLTSDEATSLIRRYDDLIGARYPFLEVDVLTEQTKELYDAIEASSGIGDESSTPLVIGIDVSTIQVLKMLLAVILACTRDSRKALQRRLFKGLQETIQEKQLVGVSNTKDLALLVLVVCISRSQLLKRELMITM